VFNENEKVLILEDVITSGISIQETSTNLRRYGRVSSHSNCLLFGVEGCLAAPHMY
jgi:orotate phosphoribosyltransferase